MILDHLSCNKNSHNIEQKKRKKTKIKLHEHRKHWSTNWIYVWKRVNDLKPIRVKQLKWALHFYRISSSFVFISRMILIGSLDIFVCNQHSWFHWHHQQVALAWFSTTITNIIIEFQNTYSSNHSENNKTFVFLVVRWQEAAAAFEFCASLS